MPLNIEEFLSNPKSILIAPAGYGKTYTIAACLKYAEENNLGKQLILTHTHAGVASIKEKIKKNNIPPSCYNVETISSFAQKYVLAFYTGNDIPAQSDGEKYHPFLIEKATGLLKISSISKIVFDTYTGLFVDEYQDCTVKQHKLILALATVLPTHILGDPLQGIFGFNNESLVNLDDENDMGEFIRARYELSEPQRWLNGNNEQLGGNLKNIRRNLLNLEEIDLSLTQSIETIVVKENELYEFDKSFNKELRRLLKEESLLIIHKESTSIYPRLKIIKTFNNQFKLIESIDDKDFYNLSNLVDSINNENLVLVIKDICSKLFNKTGIDNWFNENGLKRKTSERDKASIKPVKELIDQLKASFSLSLVSELLKRIEELSKITCYRKELFRTLCKAIEEASYNETSVYEAMVNKRNLIRKAGRKIFGKCIGTTLLTKGLEFDTVVILNAHQFDDPKHLYVAMTRASKRLVIFTENKILRPYNSQQTIQ